MNIDDRTRQPQRQLDGADVAAPGSAAARADLSLVRAALSGVENRRSELLGRLTCIERFLLGIATRRREALAHEDMLDIGQEVRLRVWRKLHEFRGAAQLETWVHRFCQFQYSNHRRRRARHPMAMGKRVDELPARVDAHDDEIDLQCYLRQLSKREAEVIRMRYVAQTSVEDIARDLRVSASTVRTLHCRALDKLRSWLPDGLRLAKSA